MRIRSKDQLGDVAEAARVTRQQAPQLLNAAAAIDEQAAIEGAVGVLPEGGHPAGGTAGLAVDDGLDSCRERFQPAQRSIGDQAAGAVHGWWSSSWRSAAAVRQQAQRSSGKAAGTVLLEAGKERHV